MNGGPAFPTVVTAWNQGAMAREVTTDEGMSLRDYFAAKAMHQFLAGARLPIGFDASEQLGMVCDRAYEAADAMLKAREA